MVRCDEKDASCINTFTTLRFRHGCHVGHRQSLKRAFVTNRLSMRSQEAHRVCQPVEDIVANVLRQRIQDGAYIIHSTIQ
ncbi:hypothetical protein Y032_0455g1752 [Ancylostoma ceylanicum]|uniref:Uncharacterized protein n=1 Tax=Ancylostoma ceylanicum TaxID=53326 RepID=A0A016WZE3_9BILA|nr:hypothetical protein Y032_0455g1752 [Ancylostoma ceylanicum]